MPTLTSEQIAAVKKLLIGMDALSVSIGPTFDLTDEEAQLVVQVLESLATPPCVDVCPPDWRGVRGPKEVVTCDFKGEHTEHGTHSGMRWPRKRVHKEDTQDQGYMECGLSMIGLTAACETWSHRGDDVTCKDCLLVMARTRKRA